jgi:ubiquinone/menaquinone biosynthesis C-methylase UbiE
MKEEIPMIKKIVKSVLQFPADALITSSKKLPRRLDTHVHNAILGNPSLTAKFYPYQADRSSYLLPKVSREDQTQLAELPIPPLDLWIHRYLDSPKAYVTLGKQYVKKMLDILETSGFSVEPGKRVLDFGCGDAMMVRHFSEIAESGEVWGVDINGTLMIWCQQHLSPPFKFATTTSFPYLPFEDGYFDLIYSFSVFTHICDLAEAWLLELRRILRRGGFLYLTVHDNHTIEVLDKDREAGLFPQLYDAEKSLSFRDSDFAMFTINRVPGGGLEFESRQAQVFYDIGYLCEHWGNYLKVISITEEAYGYQTAIVLQKH